MRLAGAAVLPIVRLFSMTNPRILFRLDDDSATDGVTTRYEYDAAGRMIKEGDKTCTYGYLDKVMSVRDGKPWRRSARWRRSFGDDGKGRWREEVPSSLRYAAVREVDGGGLLFAVVEVSERK